MELRSCVFCEHFEHIEGSSCETCGFDPNNQCAITNKSGVFELSDDQLELCKTAMKCKFFKWHPDIVKLQKNVADK